MDASNPVMSSERATIESIMGRSGRIKRQDLVYLAEVAATSQRVELPTSRNVPLREGMVILEEFKSQQVKVDSSKVGNLPNDVFEVVMESMPVCGLMNAEGIPLHPPSVNNKQGRVCVNRAMGGQPCTPMGLADIIEVIGDDVLETTKVYTGGTWNGFVCRLRQQMARTTVPLMLTMSEGAPWSRKTLIAELDKYMPRTPNKEWPGVHGDFYEGLTSQLQITSNASAGAPYWRNKGECMEEIIDVGIPIVLQHIKSGTLETLYRENPEMFLCEVKNKLDRYDKSKLDEKTRPYVCVPAHWAFLFSMIAQGFQKTLQVFDQVGGDCCNAYGFSSSQGGLKRMVEWMTSATKRGKVVCYGDDACIVVKRKGAVWRIDPDFKQMDGSLDADDISLTVDWMINHLEKDLGGKSTFWRTVGEVWKEMATHPVFIVDGTTIYKKKSPNGLMTGVPGTTLFDTVKSVLAWNRLLDVCDAGGGDILDPIFVTKWMKSQGLIVKPGTYVPARLPEIIPGNLVTDHKFLGVQILCVNWRDTIQFVPTIPYEEAVEMLVVQKDNPFSRKVSRTMQARTLFDRMRGLMITMGFTIPGISEAIHNVVNRLPPEVILMDVQIEGGQKPDHITLQDFSYPDSTGFPSFDFCVSVYSDLPIEKPSWLQIYPMLTDKLIEMKNQRRQLNQQYRLCIKDGDVKSVGMCVVEEKPIPKEYEVVEALKGSKTPSNLEVVNKRSKIAKYDDATYSEQKYLPSLGVSIILLLHDRGGISQVGTVCERFCINAHQLFRESQQFGLYLTGGSPGDLVSLYPVGTPFPSVQEEISQKAHDHTAIGVGTTQRMASKKRADQVARTAPEFVQLQGDMLSALPVMETSVSNEEEALVAMHRLVARQFEYVKWSSTVDPAKANPVGMKLLLGHPGGPIEIAAEAWSSSRKLAQGYIARAILELNGIEIQSSKYSSPKAPAPTGVPSWAAEVEYFEDPCRQPDVFDIKPANNIPTDLLIELQHDFDLSESRIRAAYVINQNTPSPSVSGLKSLLKRLVDYDQRKRNGETPAPVVAAVKRSNNSKLSPAVRTKRNRKMHERRKNRLSAPPI